MKSLLILVAAFALAVAMVPIEQREKHQRSEEKSAAAFNASVAKASSNTSSSTTKPQEICAENTPCAWSVYKRELRIVEFTINNIYCICEPDLACVETEDDFMASAFVHRCRKLKVRPSTSTEDDPHS